MLSIPLEKPAHKTLYEWCEEPIYVGGDRFSKNPGLIIQLTPFTNSSGFDITIRPIQPDRVKFTQRCLQLLGNKQWYFLIHSGDELAISGNIYIANTYEYATGEGRYRHTPQDQDAPLTLKFSDKPIR